MKGHKIVSRTDLTERLSFQIKVTNTRSKKSISTSSIIFDPSSRNAQITANKGSKVAEKLIRNDDEISQTSQDDGTKEEKEETNNGVNDSHDKVDNEHVANPLSSFSEPKPAINESNEEDEIHGRLEEKGNEIQSEEEHEHEEKEEGRDQHHTEEQPPHVSIVPEDPPKPLPTVLDDATISQWKCIFNLERNRESFFDYLFTYHPHLIMEKLEIINNEDGNKLEVGGKPDLKTLKFGSVSFKGLNTYTGDLEDGYFHGKGRYEWKDGTVYEGDFKFGVPHGSGTITWPSDQGVDTFSGQFEEGSCNHSTSLFISNEGPTYVGEWDDFGLPHGIGKVQYNPNVPDTDYYVGHWLDGVEQGYGVRKYTNGSIYKGHWEQGIQCGEGMMAWPFADMEYEGLWINGVPNGQGSIRYSKHEYFGDIVNGKAQGVGRMRYPCGTVYEGRWRSGQRHGKGVIKTPKGEVLICFFNCGNLIGGTNAGLYSATGCA